MNWADISIWKRSTVSTFICLLGCSVGSMGISFYLIHYNKLFVFIASLITGLLSCMVFMIIWEMLLHKIVFKSAVKHSLKMSLIPLLIMIISENLVVLFIVPEFSSQHTHINASHDFNTMLLAMSVGFLLSLPYTYYQLQKTGKAHHS